MKLCLSVLLAGLALVGLGCTVHVQSPPEYRHYPPPTPPAEYPAEKINTNFDARIDAAKSMMNFMQQDAALSAIAIDAANVYDIEHTLKALSLINNFMTHDETAEKCVTPFLNENMLPEARMIADKINNFMTKDRVLARIAQGPPQSY
jgi:hypothetical protein